MTPVESAFPHNCLLAIPHESVDGITVFRKLSSDESSPVNTVTVSVLIMALNEEGNLEEVLQGVHSEMSNARLSYEIVVIDGGSVDQTVLIAERAGARVIAQKTKGYAEGLVEAFGYLSGEWVLTLDGDCSHEPALIPQLLEARHASDLVIGSRWIPGGSFEGPRIRLVLSRFLNLTFRWLLDLPVHDLSSGYRLYRRSVVHQREYRSKNFSILEEILVRAHNEGFRLCEVPLRYKNRVHGSSHVRLVAFAWSFLSTLLRMWALRNSPDAGDYEGRAALSPIPMQRWWQKRRTKNFLRLLGEYSHSGRVLAMGGGSSRVVTGLPHAVAFDRSLAKLRHLASYNQNRVCGEFFELPFSDASFDCVVQLHVLEHVPQDPRYFAEVRRVLRTGGVAIIGTVNFGSVTWPLIRLMYRLFLPHSYIGNHPSKPTLSTLKANLAKVGIEPTHALSTLGGEIVVSGIAR